MLPWQATAEHEPAPLFLNVRFAPDVHECANTGRAGISCPELRLSWYVPPASGAIPSKPSKNTTRCRGWCRMNKFPVALERLEHTL